MASFEITCEGCKKIFCVPYKSWTVKRFCGVSCARKNQKNRYLSGLEKGRAWNKGITGLQSWQNISGLRPRKEGEYTPTEKTRLKISLAKRGKPSHKKGIPSLIRGHLHPLWRGNQSERKEASSKLEYINWRKEVFERDDYTCVICHERGGKLQADHIEPWSVSIEKRYDLSNGRTLCIFCHAKTPSFPKGLANYILRSGMTMRAAVQKSGG